MGYGIVCGDMSSPTLSHLLVSNNGLGGITIKQKAGPLIDKTCITSNIGTGVDISSSARPKIRNCNIKTNIGTGRYSWRFSDFITYTLVHQCLRNARAQVAACSAGTNQWPDWIIVTSMGGTLTRSYHLEIATLNCAAQLSEEFA